MFIVFPPLFLGFLRNDEPGVAVGDRIIHQLIGAAGAVTYAYTYDNAGNILTATKAGTVNTYTYGDADWGDLLTAYNGTPIQYDSIGNPTDYYNGWDFTWEHGRELAEPPTAARTSALPMMPTVCAQPRRWTERSILTTIPAISSPV